MSEMQVIKAGVHYVAAGTNNYTQDILFCHKDENGKFVEGLTNEGLMDVLIHRFNHLVSKNDLPCNMQILVFLKQARMQMNQRNKEKLNYRRIHNDSSRTGIPVQASGGGDRHEPSK